MLVRYLNNRVLAILSGLAVALGILALILIFGFHFACEPVLVSSARNCDAGTSGFFGVALLLPYLILTAIASILALVKTAVTRQYVWFAAIFLTAIFFLSPIVILAFSLLTPNERAQTIRGLRKPDHDDLRDYRSPRPA